MDCTAIAVCSITTSVFAAGVKGVVVDVIPKTVAAVHCFNDDEVIPDAVAVVSGFSIFYLCLAAGSAVKLSGAIYFWKISNFSSSFLA